MRISPNKLDLTLYTLMGGVTAALGLPFLSDYAKGALAVANGMLLAWKAARHQVTDGGADGNGSQMGGNGDGSQASNSGSSATTNGGGDPAGPKSDQLQGG